MKKKIENRLGVIILGGHVQAYGIMRIYSENGIPCVVVDNTKFNIARHSKFCKNFYKFNIKDTLSLLNSFRDSNMYKQWLLIPTTDEYVKILSQNKSKLESYFKVSIDSWKVVKKFYNKRYTYILANSLNIPIPKTYFPKNIFDLKNSIKLLQYPCIIKPAVMHEFYARFKKKVFICNNEKELYDIYRKVSKFINEDDFFIQEIIPGSNENQFSIGIFFKNNKIYNFIMVKRKRQHPIDFGNATTYAETVFIPEILYYAEKILQATNYWGICEVEFKYDYRDKKYKLLEVNPRTWKWHLISRKAKIPFLMNIYSDVHKRKIKYTNFYPSASWIDPITDIPTRIKMKLKKIYKKGTIDNIQQAVFNRNDIAPFIYQIIYLPYNIMKR